MPLPWLKKMIEPVSFNVMFSFKVGKKKNLFYFKPKTTTIITDSSLPQGSLNKLSLLSLTNSVLFSWRVTCGNLKNCPHLFLML